MAVIKIFDECEMRFWGIWHSINRYDQFKLTVVYLFPVVVDDDVQDVLSASVCYCNQDILETQIRVGFLSDVQRLYFAQRHIKKSLILVILNVKSYNNYVIK